MDYERHISKCNAPSDESDDEEWSPSIKQAKSSQSQPVRKKI